MISHITQSFIKDMREYLVPFSDMCGHLIRHKWVDGKLLEGSADMKLGAYFEYRVTGALPKDGKIPRPEYTQSGKMTAPYERAEKNAKRVLAYLDEMGLVKVKHGTTLTRGRFRGTIDAIYRATKRIVFEDGFVLEEGDEIIIDFKYGGTLDDRWSKHGWLWTDEQKKYHGTQAIQYHYVGKRPFFFLPCSSKNEVDIKFFRVEVSETAIDNHITEANDLYGHFQALAIKGFTPRPSVSKCMECPLWKDCTDRHTFPHPQLVTL